VIGECGLRTIEVRGSHEGDVDTQVTVVGGAVQAEVDAKGHRRPSRVLGTAIEAKLDEDVSNPSYRSLASIAAYLIRRLRLELLEQLQGLLLGSKRSTHDGGQLALGFPCLSEVSSEDQSTSTGLRVPGDYVATLT
jgi:hypothetical protein